MRRSMNVLDVRYGSASIDVFLVVGYFDVHVGSFYALTEGAPELRNQLL